jgi:hypothetical protein
MRADTGAAGATAGIIGLKAQLVYRDAAERHALAIDRLYSRSWEYIAIARI